MALTNEEMYERIIFATLELVRNHFSILGETAYVKHIKDAHFRNQLVISIEP